MVVFLLVETVVSVLVLVPLSIFPLSDQLVLPSVVTSVVTVALPSVPLLLLLLVIPGIIQQVGSGTTKECQLILPTKCWRIILMNFFSNSSDSIRTTSSTDYGQ
uniref:Uncharacterized protein n=1 Tax=Ciona intestinalis TaxID=7719 RepID=F6VCV6_CIOIN